MKTAFLSAFLILLLVTTANAQGKGTTKGRARKSTPTVSPDYNYLPSAAQAPVAAPEPAPSSNRYYISALYSSANALKYKGKADLFGTPTAYTATESTTGALGFAAGYLSREAGHLGYNAEIAYELPRTSSGVEGMLGNQGIHGSYDVNPSNSILTLSANGNYSLNSQMYFFGGLNFPFTSGSSNTLGALPGYQLGGGYSWSRHISSELSYRVLRMKGTIESPGFNLQVDEATFSGLILAVHYLF